VPPAALPDLRLTGIAGPAGVLAAHIVGADGKIGRYTAGATVDGWTIEAVMLDGVELGQNGRRFLLRFPSPGDPPGRWADARAKGARDQAATIQDTRALLNGALGGD
jgi:hypothetical protein